MKKISNLVKQYVHWPEIENKLQKNYNFSTSSLSDFTPLLETVLHAEMNDINSMILRFYGMNEALSKLRMQEHQMLDKNGIALYQAYHDEVNISSQKIFAYILLTATMEVRNCIDYMNSDVYKSSFKYREYFLSEQEFESFQNTHSILMQVSSLCSDRQYDNIIKLFNSDDFKHIQIGKFLHHLTILFSGGDFADNYGGDAWCDISSHLQKFVKGRINPEVFVDQAFSLEHNGGQIFNKEIIFNHPGYIDLQWHNMKDNQSQTHRYTTGEFLLNLQHQGCILSLLNHQFEGKYTASKQHYTYVRKNALIASDTTYKSYEKATTIANDNLNILKHISDNFTAKNRSFMQLLEKNNIPGAQLLMMDVLSSQKIAQHTFKTPKAFAPFMKYSDYLEYQQSHSIEHAKDFYFAVHDTSSLDISSVNKEQLGNKAYGLLQLQNMDMPVLKSLVFPTANAHSYFSHYKKWQQQLQKQLKNIQHFLKDENQEPILCSVRSGAPVSMPGMMDTILNVGIDDSNYDYYCKKMGKDVAHECAIAFMQMFCNSYFHIQPQFSDNLDTALSVFKQVLIEHNVQFDSKLIFPLNQTEQIKFSIEAVFSSWYSERAVAYRKHHHISDELGTAAIIQQMAYGNLNDLSCSGVVFSRNCITGEKNLIGEFLTKTQGEAVVSGSATPLDITQLAIVQPQVYAQLNMIAQKLEQDAGYIQDIEFTVENGKLYILQKRNAVCSMQAHHQLLHEMFDNKNIDKRIIKKHLTNNILLPQYTVNSENTVSIATGMIANPGVVQGIVVTCEADIKKYQAKLEQLKLSCPDAGWIFCAKETKPEHANLMMKTHGFITQEGGFTCHAAILARSWNKPCIVATHYSYLQSGQEITVDASQNSIYNGILPISCQEANNETLMKSILHYYKVNLQESAHYNIHENINKINEKTLWLNQYIDTSQMPHNKNIFLNISERIVRMLLAENTKENNKNYRKIS